MKGRSQDFVLGLTVIALFALFLVSFFYLSDAALGGGERRSIEVRFPLQTGMAPLKPGSVVLLRGAVDVGAVTYVKIEPGDQAGEAQLPVIVVRADVDVIVPLYTDCRISTSEAMLGGTATLVIIDVGSPAAGELKSDKFVLGERPQSLQAAIGDLSDRMLGEGGLFDQLEHMLDADAEGTVMQKIMASLDDINVLTAELSGELNAKDSDALMNKLHSILGNINELTAALRAESDTDTRASLLAKVHLMLDRVDESLVTMHGMLTDARPQVQETLEHVAGATRTIDEQMLPALLAEFERDDPSSLIAKIHVSMDHTTASMANIHEVTESGKRMLIVNRPAIDSAVANVKETSVMLKNLVTDIMLNPWRLMKPDQAERERIEVFQAAQMFAQAAARLDDVSARLAALQEATPAGERDADETAEIEALRAALKDAFARFHEAEDFLWKSVK
ncbi:MAG: hypothetical protein JXO22_00905 [Phycisphaerae bacterium]|nr:hypothetical protein [Phycisphaerae bacterium]